MNGFTSLLSGNVINHFRFLAELLVSCAVFSIPVNKRRYWPLRMALLSLLLILASLPLRPPSLPFVLAKFVLDFLAAVVWLRFCCAISWNEALFSAGCAYATQHFAASLFSIFIRLCPEIPLWGTAIVYVLCYGGIYFSFYWLFLAHLTENGRYTVSHRRSIVMVLVLLPFAMVFSLAVDAFGADQPTVIYCMCRLYDLFCSIFVLWVQVSVQQAVRFQTQAALEHQMRISRQEQYQLSRENISLINRKCHDLKHQVQALRHIYDPAARDASLQEMEQAVMLYDGVARTGNEALDIVLTEKSLLCQKNHITWTCMADGSHLEFMDEVDLYTLFGNLIDNAVESVLQLEDPEQRVIGVKLYSRDGLQMLQVENYYAGVLQYRDGLPATSKGDTDFHGFGLKSIRHIVEKYGGSMTLHDEDHIFQVRILFPLSEGTAA